MKVLFHTPGVKPTKKLTEFAAKKVEMLSRMHNHIIECHVHLKKIKSDTPDNKICEILLSVPGNDLFASKKYSTFQEALIKAVDAIKRQIKDNKPENQVTTPL